MYAVVATGGKQYRVEPGSTLTVEKLSEEPGGSVVLDRVLLLGGGEALTIGTPLVDGASVSATVLGPAKGPKLVIFKFKPKVKYRRRTGHRQHLTLLRVDEIRGPGGISARADSVEEPRSRAEAGKPKAAERSGRKAAKADKPGGAGKATTAAKPDRADKAAKRVKGEKAAPESAATRRASSTRRRSTGGSAGPGSRNPRKASEPSKE